MGRDLETLRGQLNRCGNFSIGQKASLPFRCRLFLNDCSFELVSLVGWPKPVICRMATCFATPSSFAVHLNAIFFQVYDSFSFSFSPLPIQFLLHSREYVHCDSQLDTSLVYRNVLHACSNPTFIDNHQLVQSI